MVDGSVAELADKTDCDLVVAGTGNRKPNRIPIAVSGQMRTVGCIPKIAELPQVVIGGRYFIPCGATVARPSRSEREARGMRP